jgi:hypothetical protein
MDDPVAFKCAVLGGSLDCLKYLFENGCMVPFDYIEPLAATVMDRCPTTLFPPELIEYLFWIYFQGGLLTRSEGT